MVLAPSLRPSPSLLLLPLHLAFILPFTFACTCGNTGSKLPLDPFDPLGPWHQRHLDCGIPPFAYRLPQDAQDKIHAIWLNYQIGDDCGEEQEQTRAVIMAIPEEIRLSFFKSVCGPSFLRNATEEATDQFRQVWFNESMNVEQKQAEFQKLAKELLTGESLKRFEHFDQKLSEQIQKRQEMVQKLSGPAREAYGKWQDMRKEERQFLASLPADVRAELGLLCACCGTCKTGQKTAQAETSSPKEGEKAAPTRAERSAGAEEEVARLADGLARSERMAALEAAVAAVGAECPF